MKRTWLQGAGPPKTKARGAASGSRFGECPVCGRSVPLVGLPAHVDKCLEAGPPPGDGKEGREEAAAPERAADDAGAGGPEPKDALRLLTEAARRPAAPRSSFGRRTGHTVRGGGYRPTTLRPLEVLDAALGMESPSPPDRGGVGPATLRPSLSPSVGLPGHFVVENFLTPEEERAILASLDHDVSAAAPSFRGRGTDKKIKAVNPWRFSPFNGSSMGKCFGVRVDLAKRTVRPPDHPMPEWTCAVVERMNGLGLEVLEHFAPNECNAIDYRKGNGHYLLAHCDDRQMSGDVICNLSLAGAATMVYTAEKGQGRRVDVLLPRRSLQIQAGGVRYDVSSVGGVAPIWGWFPAADASCPRVHKYEHGIPNANLLNPRRVSVTFRETFVQDRTVNTVHGYQSVRKRDKWGKKLA